MSGDPAGVSLNATVGVTNPRNGGGTIPSVAQMTAVDVLGRVDELTDGTGGSVDAVMGATIGPYPKSRVNGKQAEGSNALVTARRQTMTATTAHDYCLQGKELLAHNRHEDNDTAIACFQKALELDATYAPAYAGLSRAYAQRQAPLGLGRNWLDKAVTAAEKAVELAPNLEEGPRSFNGVLPQRLAP